MCRLNYLLLVVATFFLVVGFVLYAKKEQVTIGLAVGQKAPELELPTPEGVKLKLSSLQGQYVLIDFWASWCRPCRSENPNLVRAYLKYKDSRFYNGNGFTILGVSLDNSRSAWLDAINSDSLIWTSQMSDLKGWHSAAAQVYLVEGIPTNFLVNEKGIIIAKNLRGSNLHITLESFMRK